MQLRHSRQARRHHVAALLMLIVVLSSGLFAKLQASTDDNSLLLTTAQKFLENEFSHLGEEVQVSVSPPSLDISDCPNPAPFLQQTAINSSGRIFVGIDCQSQSRSQQQRFFLQAEIKVFGHYLRTNRKIDAGTTLQAAMFDTEYGDITHLISQGVIGVEEVSAYTARHTLSLNRIVTGNQLRLASLVDRGEVVQFSVSGGGFTVSGQAEALEAGNPGDRIRIRTDARKTLSGTIMADGGVSVSL